MVRLQRAKDKINRVLAGRNVLGMPRRQNKASGHAQKAVLAAHVPNSKVAAHAHSNYEKTRLAAIIPQHSQTKFPMQLP